MVRKVEESKSKDGSSSSGICSEISVEQAPAVANVLSMLLLPRLGIDHNP